MADLAEPLVTNSKKNQAVTREAQLRLGESESMSPMKALQRKQAVLLLLFVDLKRNFIQELRSSFPKLAAASRGL